MNPDLNPGQRKLPSPLDVQIIQATLSAAAANPGLSDGSSAIFAQVVIVPDAQTFKKTASVTTSLIETSKSGIQQRFRSHPETPLVGAFDDLTIFASPVLETSDDLSQINQAPISDEYFNLGYYRIDEKTIHTSKAIANELSFENSDSISPVTFDNSLIYTLEDDLLEMMALDHLG